jgi:hypothetical protein
MIHARRLTLAALPLALALAAAAAAAAAPSGPEAAPAPVADPAAAQTATPAAPATPTSPGGLVAARDPETGELRAPTAEEMAALASELAPLRSHEGLVPVTLPDGTVMVDVQGRFLEFALATRVPNQAIVTHCTGDPAQVVALLTGAKPAAEAGVAAQPYPQEVRDDR